MPDVLRFFGVPVNETAQPDARWIVTANPEILLHARKDADYRNAILRADSRVADGFGVVLMARLFGKKITRITGVDLADHAIKHAAEAGWTVALVGGGDRPGTAQKALDALRGRFPSLHGIAHDGGRIHPDGTGDATDDEVIQQLTQASPDVMLIGFGHPKQERWIARNLESFPSVKTIIGVGGTFDYWAGNAKRAPRWMRAIGLEWLFRLVAEPKRWNRIWNAVIVFPIAVLWERLKNRLPAGGAVRGR